MPRGPLLSKGDVGTDLNTPARGHEHHLEDEVKSPRAGFGTFPENQPRAKGTELASPGGRSTPSHLERVCSVATRRDDALGSW